MLVAVALVVAVAAAIRGMWSPCGLSMLTSMNPMAEAARGQRYGVTAVAYAIGALVGSAAPAAVAALGAVGVAALDPSTSTVAVVAIAAAGIGALSDSRLVGWRLPTHPRQVDEDWLARYRGWVYGFGFGVQIGAGFATYIMTAATYLMVVLAALTGEPLVAALVVGAFGLVRGLSVFWSVRYRSFEAMADHQRWLHRHADASLATMAGLQITVALVLSATVLRLVVVVPVALAIGLATVVVAGRRARRPGATTTTPAAAAPRAARA